MEKEREARTSASLLSRLQSADNDEDAWREFVGRYGPKISGWCRHWGLQESDATDVTQEVLTALVRKLRAFRYDASRSFRAWLKTLAHHAWHDFLENRRRGGMDGALKTIEALETVAARDDLEKQLAQPFDQELLDEAMARVQVRVAPHTWEAFRLLTFDGLSGPEVAPRVGMQVTMVYVAKSKVQKMLREEIDKLEGREE